MRALAMRFRGIVRGADVGKLTVWLRGAERSGLYGIRRFVHTLRRDLAAVRNAITETWSNGQVEGQINRLKTLKRAMYGRAGDAPSPHPASHSLRKTLGIPPPQASRN